jgi:hypothetical protein
MTDERITPAQRRELFEQQRRAELEKTDKPAWQAENREALLWELEQAKQNRGAP